MLNERYFIFHITWSLITYLLFELYLDWILLTHNFCYQIGCFSMNVTTLWFIKCVIVTTVKFDIWEIIEICKAERNHIRANFQFEIKFCILAKLSEIMNCSIYFTSEKVWAMKQIIVNLSIGINSYFAFSFLF